MSIHVEFYGIPRQRCGRASVIVESAGPIFLRTVLNDLSRRFPTLAVDCFRDGELSPGYVANVAGKEFVDDPLTQLADGTTLLIMSSDAGG